MSGKRWALYATNHRLGTHREHRLAGARLGRVGVTLNRTVMRGWEVAISVARVSFAITIRPSQKDPQVAVAIRTWFPRADLDRGLEDVRRGRTFHHSDDGRGAPFDTWQPDDPVQPKGWEHDGTRWVLKQDGGWFRDRYGYWRYTAPGENGWRQKSDLSWEYVGEAVSA